MGEQNVDFTAVAWIKSSYSDGGSNCVEAAVSGGVAGVRDSKLGDSPIQTHSGNAWGRLLDGLRGK